MLAILGGEKTEKGGKKKKRGVRSVNPQPRSDPPGK